METSELEIGGIQFPFLRADTAKELDTFRGMFTASQLTKTRKMDIPTLKFETEKGCFLVSIWGLSLDPLSISTPRKVGDLLNKKVLLTVKNGKFSISLI